jgi:hypothetical protein
MMRVAISPRLAINIRRIGNADVSDWDWELMVNSVKPIEPQKPV